jgi:hypothetical protein
VAEFGFGSANSRIISITAICHLYNSANAGELTKHLSMFFK